MPSTTLAKLQSGDAKGAIDEAYAARDRNPLSLEPLSVLAVAQIASEDVRAEEATLQDEVSLQPANRGRGCAWQTSSSSSPRRRCASLKRAVGLDPRNEQTVGAYLAVRRQVTGS
jgi:hypothetical protein